MKTLEQRQRAAEATRRWKDKSPENRLRAQATTARWRERHRDEINAQGRLRSNMMFYQSVEYLGGSCADCGYHDNLNGLEFDHLPGTEKHREVSVLLTSSRWETIQAELDKCELVCGTCHNIRTADRRHQHGY